MLVRAGSLQTHDEFWINPDHIVSIRVDRTSKAATIKLSDGSTHNVKTGTGVAAPTADLGRLLADGPGAGVAGRPARSDGRRDRDASEPVAAAPNAARPMARGEPMPPMIFRSRSMG